MSFQNKERYLKPEDIFIRVPVFLVHCGTKVYCSFFQTESQIMDGSVLEERKGGNSYRKGDGWGGSGGLGKI